MAVDLFTASQPPENPANLSASIRSSVAVLQAAYPAQKVEVLHWNDSYVAVPLNVEIDLPTRGPVGGMDIREEEPVFLLFHRSYYPHRAPLACSNRRDFPAASLPHLNPTRPGSAPSFCLHRGNLDSWFAEHTILDFVQRVRGWLRDAARNRLIRPGDGFETTRISQATGLIIYEPPRLVEWVQRSWADNAGRPGFTPLWLELLKNPALDPLVGSDAYALRLVRPVTEPTTADLLPLARQLNGYHSEKVQLDRHLVGVLAWPAEAAVCGQYFGSLPDELGPFEHWAHELGIPLRDALQRYLADDLQLLGGVPVIVAVPRPQRLIGCDHSLELLNFVVVAGGDHWPKDGSWDLAARVGVLSHRAPLTQRRAREISSWPVDADLGRLLVVGCGAVGSKLVLHLARSGQGLLTLVDHDELSPHNLVRHALTHEALGRNKAEALRDAIRGMFRDDTSVQVEAVGTSVLSM